MAQILLALVGFTSSYLFVSILIGY